MAKTKNPHRGGDKNQFSFPKIWCTAHGGQGVSDILYLSDVCNPKFAHIYVRPKTMCIEIAIRNGGMEHLAGPFESVEAITEAYKLHGRLRGSK